MRNLSDEDYGAIAPTGMRLHQQPSLILPEHQDASKSAWTRAEAPQSVGHHRGATDWLELWEWGEGEEG